MSNDNASPLTFDAALAAFVAAVQEGFDKQNAKMAENFPEGYYKPIVLEAGSKNIRLVCTAGHGRSVYCFVRKSDGAILKAAGWKMPAKHSRGSVFDPKSYEAARSDCYTGWLYLR